MEALIEALEGDHNRIRAQAMPLLALIHDPRAKQQLIAMLLDRDAKLREIAARSVGRFPCHEAVMAFERLLDRERDEHVRVAAICALVEQYAAGQEQAIRRVLEAAYDGGETTTVRMAALALLPLLGGSQRRGLLKKLKLDPDPEVSEKARQLERADEVDTRTRHGIRSSLLDLASEDYATWNDAVHRLATCGQAVIAPLIGEMRARAHDPEYCTRAGMVLKALGPRRARPLADMLEQVGEPLPLQVLVEVIGVLGEKSMIYRLRELIDRLNTLPRAAIEANGFDTMQRVRAKAHLELARIGSRLAAGDLRDALRAPDRRVDLELLRAVELVGKRDEIGDLLRAYQREDRFMRERIAEVIRRIMKRERIRRNDPMLHTLGEEQRRSLAAILPPVDRTRSAGAAPARVSSRRSR